EVSVTLINQGGIVKPEIRSYSGIGEEKETQEGKLISLSVLKANELTILTNVRVFDKLSNEIVFKESISGTFDSKNLLTNHIQDFNDKFRRVSLTLAKEEDSKDKLPYADQLLEQTKNKNVPPKLFELIFQIGRYALLSCSRSGGLPANLQGLWSDGYSPAWNCRYQLDINLQMCYWLANPVNLAECNLPLFDYLEKLVPAAIKRSKDLYNCRGISLPVGVDEHNVRYPSNSETQCVAGWMAQHFWEHYLFTSDKEFLIKRAYPFMLKAGEFFEDFLYENKEGKYVILPSSSPENHPRNFPGRLSMNATVDLAVAKELFNNLIKASHILGVDGQKRKKWHKIIRRLPAWPVGGDGTLLEWADNNAIESQEHRHLSHLYPLYPGSLFDIEETPELVDSAVKAIRKREAAFLEDACGWSYTWLVALYARAGMAEDAYRNLVVYLKGFVTADNFLSTISDLSGLGLGRIRHGKLIQVEAGLGITAAIAEMLLQSHNGLIRILPALPKCWDEGSVEGLKARGNYEIDIIWKSGYIDKVMLKSKTESVCRIKFYRDFKGEMKFRANDKKDFNDQLEKSSNNIFVFRTEINAEYEFYAD
ncbi:glycosyl hydrolase family 95 catalytic domain-containing protein, partial [Mariniphaga sediminis]|uniref:glycosyl hydrolase family 95 catalytic domain-containing protein n=1 Tax=Mariniphaga sediminis TaxID=1628158 RepID=UPI00356A1706